jgi:hypothetical protein
MLVRRSLLVLALVATSACDKATPVDPAKAAPTKAEVKSDAKASAGADTAKTAAKDDAPKPSPASDDVRADFDDICNAKERSGASAEPDDSQRAMVMAKWLTGKLRTNEAKDLMASLATEDPAARPGRLRDAAKRAGVEPCPFADEESTPRAAGAK